MALYDICKLKSSSGTVIVRGVSITDSAYFTLNDQQRILWAADDDVIALINSGSLIVNNGTSDLSALLGVELLKKNYGAVKFTELTDTPANYTGSGSKIVTVKSSVDGLEFKNLSAIPNSGRIISGNFIGDDSHLYIKASSSTYTAMGYVVFPGTSIFGNISTIYLIVHNNKDDNYSDYRIYDSTNVNVIAEYLNHASINPVIINMGTISNVPSGQSIFEVQGRKSATSGTDPRLSHISIYS